MVEDNLHYLENMTALIIRKEIGRAESLAAPKMYLLELGSQDLGSYQNQQLESWAVGHPDS